MGTCHSKTMPSEQEEAGQGSAPLRRLASTTQLAEIVCTSAVISTSTLRASQRKGIKRAMAVEHMQRALALSVMVFEELAGQVPMFGPICTVIGQ